MKVNLGVARDLGTIADEAIAAESQGYDGIWTAELAHDPFLPLAIVAEHTERLDIGTSIAVAFARAPMITAGLAYDLNAFSGGRFILGLGSQIKAHIVKRFSMPWSKPATRMREYVDALHAIWDCWLGDGRLDFQGEFYSHTLMTPVFNPGHCPEGKPRVFVAGVGEQMTEVAGEVGDGFLAHAFTTERYLREVTLPALERGRARAARHVEDFEVAAATFIVTGADERQVEQTARLTRQQLAFYASTPAYRPVLELHGWGDLHEELRKLSFAGKWEAMGDLVDDEILRTFAIIADPSEVAGRILDRFGEVADRITFPPLGGGSDIWTPIIDELHAADVRKVAGDGVLTHD